MPDDARTEAEELLRAPDLVERVGRDIETVGVTGERMLATTLYLIGTTVQLPRPLSALIVGATSSGKSFVVTCVQDLIPPESKEPATDTTPNSLYYVPEGFLSHKWIIGGERSRVEDDQRAEAKRALREMLESQTLVKMVTVTTDGLPETVRITQRGPIAFTETTTNAEIFEEDRNRCLVLYTDESPEQTRAILRQTARAAAGESRGDVSRIVAVHHAVQRMIPRCDVIIPFAREIEPGYPAHRVDARRAFRHLLQFVKAVALLHFMQRERNGDGNVIATRDDYRIAVDLAEMPLAVAVGALSSGARAFYGRLTARFPADQGFSVTEACDATSTPKSTAHRHLAELAGACLVEVSRYGAGRADVWRRTSRAVPTAITLPVLRGEDEDLDTSGGENSAATAAPVSPLASVPRRGPVDPPPWA